MATIQIQALTALTKTQIKATDKFALGTSDNTTRAVLIDTFLEFLGIQTFDFADIPTGYAGGMIFVLNGRKAGEGAAAGTGVLCTWNGSNWITTDAGSTVAA